MSKSARRSVLVTAIVLLGIATPLGVWMTATPVTSGFTDSVELGENKLGAGRLDLGAPQSGVTISATHVAPGDQIATELYLDNRGDLALTYTLTATVEGSELAPWTTWWLSEPGRAGCDDGKQITPPAVMTGIGTDMTAGMAAPRPVAAGGNDILCLHGQVGLEAPNSMQGKRIALRVDAMAVHDPSSDATTS
jgi:hypothetical protein